MKPVRERKPTSKETERLTANLPKGAKPAAINAAINALPPGRHHDGSGLYLQVVAPVNPINPPARSWVLRFMLAGKPRTFGLGRFPDVSIADAREAARVARLARRNGVDPIATRQAERAALLAKQAAERAAREAPVWTFQRAGEAYVKAVGRKWTPGHEGTWAATLRDYAYPVIGALPVANISKHDVVRTLAPIWRDMPPTADRLRGRIETILDFATAQDWRSGDNPAKWDVLQHLMEGRVKATAKHHPAMPYADLPAFWQRLSEQTGVAVPALQFTILTAARSGEVRGATWNEIDLDGATWTIPAERMKADNEHVVPLTEPALALLREAAKVRQSDLVFNGRDAKSPLGEASFAQLMRKMTSGKFSTHGFRSSFSTFAQNETTVAREVTEMSLAHSIGNAVERSYARGDLMSKRLALMNTWATFVTSAKPASRIKWIAEDDEPTTGFIIAGVGGMKRPEGIEQ